jgi:polyhydroxyalkanoate synthesis regulator phasin
VRAAKLRLEAMSVDTITAIRSKQAARLVLAKEAELVKTMVREGLITSNYAEEFLDEIGSDTARIEKERNLMHR